MFLVLWCWVIVILALALALALSLSPFPFLILEHNSPVAVQKRRLLVGTNVYSVAIFPDPLPLPPLKTKDWLPTPH